MKLNVEQIKLSCINGKKIILFYLKHCLVYIVREESEPLEDEYDDEPIKAKKRK